MTKKTITSRIKPLALSIIAGFLIVAAWGISGSVAQAETEGSLIIPHFETNQNQQGFEINGGVFRIGPSSNNIDPPTEDVTLEVGSFSITIPAGSFEVVESGGRQFCLFDGIVNGVELSMEINPTRSHGEFSIFAESSNADVSGSSGSVIIGLRVGDDTAETRALTGS